MPVVVRGATIREWLLYENLAIWWLRVWGMIRTLDGKRVYVHDVAPCHFHRFPIFHHRLSLPSDGPMLILCPKGAVRMDPAAWRLPMSARIVTEWGEPSWIEHVDGIAVVRP